MALENVTILDRVLEYIKAYKRDHNGISPTLRDIVRDMELSSTSVAHYYLEKMYKSGVIYRIHLEGNRVGIGVPNSSWVMDNEVDGG